MGVIDLDARVKKLEQDGGGLGPVVDQMEADLTALDEQINGDGETDLGLAGTVAALVNELSVTDLTDELTNVGSFVSTIHFQKTGNVAEFIATMDKTTPTGWTAVAYFPEEYGPVADIVGDRSNSPITDLEKSCEVTVKENRVVMNLATALVNDDSTRMDIHAMWIINPPEPTPTE